MQSCWYRYFFCLFFTLSTIWFIWIDWLICWRCSELLQILHGALIPLMMSKSLKITILKTWTILAKVRWVFLLYRYKEKSVLSQSCLSSFVCLFPLDKGAVCMFGTHCVLRNRHSNAWWGCILTLIKHHTVDLSLGQTKKCFCYMIHWKSALTFHYLSLLES